METQSQTEVTMQNKMLPPQPGTFEDREDLVKYVRDFGASQGYVVTIKKSRKDRRVILGCDRGGVYRNRRKIDESKRKRKASSRLINCPFEAIGKKEDDLWVLTVKNGEHNHEALKDMSEHPYSRRFTEEEVRQIKQMTEAGVKPRQVLKALKQINPELQSTPRHLYNLKAKIRQGNLSEKSFKSWRPDRSALVSTIATASGESLKQNNQPVRSDLKGGAVVEGCFSAWWDKFDYGKIVNLVSSEFPITPVPNISPPTTSTQALLEIPENTQSLSDITHSSSLKGKSKSSKTSSSKKKGKSSQLLKMADKLIAKAALLDNEDEDEDSSSNSSDASSQHPTNPASQKTP